MRLYSIDLQIAGTLYIRASNLEEAKRLLAESINTKGGTYLEVEDVSSDIEISNLDLDDEDLPDVSLSPVMVVWGPWPGSELFPHDPFEDEDE